MGPLSSPCHCPALVGKDRMEPSLPSWCGAGRPQLPSLGRWRRGKKHRERLEECAELRISPGWRQNICWGSPAPAQGEVSGGREAPPILPPMSPSHVPKMGQKSQCCRACPFPLVSTLFCPGFPRKGGCHQCAMQPSPSAPQHSPCCWGTSVLGDTSVPRAVLAGRRAMAPGCSPPCSQVYEHAIWLQKKKPE